MALPVIALPALFATLIGAIGSAIASALGYFSAWSAKRILLVLAGIAAIATAVTLLVNTVAAALSSIAVTMPPEIQQAGLIVPDNIPACISAIVTTHVALWVYGLHLRAIEIKVN